MDRVTAEGVEVICLIDGRHTFEDADFPEIDGAEKARRLAKAGLTTVDTDFNAYLLRHAAGLDLVDAGCGTQFGPGAGRLVGLLADMGVTPDQIDRVILTHLHTDHAGGLMDGDIARFPKARICVRRTEVEYWRGRDAFRDAVLGAYASRITLLEAGDDLGQGITVWDLPGHTPGHIGLTIGGTLALVGDIVHSEALQMRDLQTLNANDVDRVMAAQSRRAAFDLISDEGMVWSGSHVLGPDKFARLARDGDGFRKVPL